MAEVKNTFLKGKMNQDLDSRLIPTGEYREAINLQISRSEGSSVGEFENMLGNTDVNILNTDADSKIIGHYVDESNHKVYLFATDWDSSDPTGSSAKNHYIYELNLSAPYNKKVLVTGTFLMFDQAFPITGVNLVEDLFFWTDNLNQPRKLNVIKANPTSQAIPTHYQNEDQISVAKYAPFEPIIVLDRVKTSINAGNLTDTFDITVTSATGIDIGDIVSPFATITPPPALWNDLIYVVAITGNVITLSKAVTVTDGFELVFQNSTMTNKTNEFLPGGSDEIITSVTGVGLAAVYVYGSSATGGYAENVPTIGAIVTGVNIPVNTTILTAVSSWVGGTGIIWSITLSNITTAVATEAIKINVNPNHESGWQGDANFLEDKFVRFSYRFKYEDNEYSLMAPFSQPMFVPKQNSTFGGGTNSDISDMDDAYKSTIVTWFENNIENILLKIPMPYASPALNATELKLVKVDILYKESDALAVKVLDTVTLSSLPVDNFETILWSDPIHGENTTTYYYQYDYASSKPYKTLPSNQTTRVYDKVPVKALAQELIGNRVVYGNYIDKHTSPASINYSALVNKKKPAFDNVVQYPYHTLKQNRTYQVGFVLSDRYGRQSDVILSSYDNLDGTRGSTVYSNYNTYNEQVAYPIIDWLGDSLNIKIDTAIDAGTTGFYSATNPLGWYSYKVVVKQQQQEYYNVYLPGFVNGIPVISNEEMNKTSFSVLLGDNINKVPRDLKEVGPTDTDYSSGETLYFRVNNPNIDSRSNRGYGVPSSTTAWNKQYYPGFIGQEVLSIQTVRDMEISAIPFIANSAKGDYGKIGTTTTGATTAPVSIGSLPWGVSAVSQPFYNSDLNPFALKIDTTPNGSIGIASTVPTFAGGIGAISTIYENTADQINSMSPFLSIAETKPVYSLLELFYETSLQGKISTLNSLINSQYGGLVYTNVSSGSFSENASPGDIIEPVITWTNGGGAVITANGDFTSPPIIESAFRANDTGNTVNVNYLFELVWSGTDAQYQLKTRTPAIPPNDDSLFFYSQASAAPLSNDVYYMQFKTTYDDGTGDPDYVDTLPYTATLTNFTPHFTDCSNPSGITIASTSIKNFTATNGSNVGNTAIIQASQLLFDLDPSNSSAILNQFSMSSTGSLTTNSALTEGGNYTIVARVRDVNGQGISKLCSISFVVGVQHVPQAICAGYQGSISADCYESFEAFFGANSSTTSTGTYPTVGGITYPENNIQFYNVKAQTNVSSPTTAALTQGVMYITPTLTVTGSESSFVWYTIQYRANSQAAWTQATQTSGVAMSSYKLNSSSGNPGTATRIFSGIGEYRFITNNIDGEACVSSAANLVVAFGDSTYAQTDCSLGPL